MSQAKILHLDLETIPNGNPDDIEVSIPKNYKDPQKIEDYVLLNKDKQFRDRAKNPSTADIICFSGAFGNDDIETFTSFEDEKSLVLTIEEFVMENIMVSSEIGNEVFELFFGGYNVRNYDLNLLWKKAIKYQAYNLAKLIPRTKYDKRVIDLLEIWTGGNGISFDGSNKFSDVQAYFGMEPKRTGMDGSMVYDFYLAGDIDAISEYCESDVEDERELFHLMVPGLDIPMPFLNK